MTVFLFTVSILSSLLLIGWSFFSPKILALTQFSPSISRTENIAPKENIIIAFPQSVSDDNYRQRILLSPSVPFYAKWESDRTRLVLSPKDFWEPGVRYALTLPKGKSDRFFSGNVNETIFTFSTIPYPTVSGVTPKNNEKDVLLDIEDPVSLSFDASTNPFWIDFSFSPDIDVTYQNDPEKTRFDLLPKSPLAPGATYTLAVFARVNADGAKPKQIFQTSFTARVPEPPKEISKDPAERLAQAKLSTPPKIIEGKYIDVDLGTQTMIAFENGVALDAYLVSSGKKGMDTPKGDFQIHNKAPKPWSKQYSLFMPHWMAITSDGKFGIHELPEWPGGYKEGANHLGTPVSHGCVRLGVGPAETVYNWAEVGTPVFIH